MGIHTWVYKNRREYDNEKVEALAQDILIAEVEKNNKLFELNESLKKSDILRSSMKDVVRKLQNYVTECSLIKSSNIRKQFIKDYESNIKNEYGSINYWYAEFVYFICGCDNIQYLNRMTDLFDEKIDYLNFDDSDKDLFFETALCQIYNVNYLNIHVDTDNGFFGLETEFHDPFRMSDQNRNLFLTRDDLESYIFDKNTEDVSVYEFSTGKENRNIKDHYIRKTENYDLFVSHTTHILNVIYEKYPDAFIYIG